MKLEKTGEFEKDIKRLDKKIRKMLKATIENAMENPERYKPLLRYKNVRTAKIEEKRLIYQYFKGERRILFLMFKKRDEVYGYLRKFL